jgi:hypothetical protein
MIKRFLMLLISIVLLTSFVLAQNNDEEREDKSSLVAVKFRVGELIRWSSSDYR